MATQETKKIKEKIIDDNLKFRADNEKKGEIMINDTFDEHTMEYVFNRLKSMALESHIKNITIYINSSGGMVNALYPIMDMINYIGKHISTVVLGKAYSCGAMLLLSGHKGGRFAHEHSSILLHEVAAEIKGKTSQVRIDVKDLDDTNKEFKKIIKAKTKMTKEQIDMYMDSNLDIFITAQQALKFGIIDKIIK